LGGGIKFLFLFTFTTSDLVWTHLNGDVTGGVLLKITCSLCTAVCKGILRLETWPM